MLPPLDLDVCITAPAPYVRTRVYAEVLTDEVIFVLAEWSHCVLTSVAFHELVFPIVTALRKTIKSTKAQHKGVVALKTLVEKLEATATWSSSKRETVEFGPGKRDEVHRWERDLDIKSAPLDVWLKTLRKTREKQKKAAAAAAAAASQASVVVDFS